MKVTVRLSAMPVLSRLRPPDCQQTPPPARSTTFPRNEDREKLSLALESDALISGRRVTEKCHKWGGKGTKKGVRERECCRGERESLREGGREARARPTRKGRDRLGSQSSPRRAPASRKQARLASTSEAAAQRSATSRRPKCTKCPPANTVTTPTNVARPHARPPASRCCL